MTLAFPKPVKATKSPKGMSRRKKPSKAVSEAEMAHMGRVKGLPCVSCAVRGISEAHHCRSDSFGGKRASGYATISLCPSCHRTGPNAYHKNKRGWEAENGKDWEWIPTMLEWLRISTSKDFS